MQSRISVTGETEKAETRIVNQGIAVTEDVECIQTTGVQTGLSVTEGHETTVTTATAVQQGISIKEDIETAYTTVVHPGMPNTKDMDALASTGTTVQSGMPVTEGIDTTKPTTMQYEAVKPNIQRMGGVSKNPGTPSPLPQSIATGDDKDSNDIVVHIGLNDGSYEQQLRELEKQESTSGVREEKEKLNTTWEECNGEFEKKVNEVTVSGESQQMVHYNCKEHFGKVKVKGTEQGSLAIHLDLPTVYNLYRLEHTCLSGSFPDSFEPLLITDKMREEADKVGLQLKLKATYDQARFDELELFFINRDGGGLKPVKVYDDVIEGKDAEEVQIDDEDTDQKSHTVNTGKVDRSSQTEQGQSTEDIQSKSEMERATLESQLKAAKEEMAASEERCKELTQKLESSENFLVSQRIGTNVKQNALQSELEKKETRIKELENTVEELKHKLELSELEKHGDKGDWSVTLVNGQHQGRGQKFKLPCGLAFHRDKLVVCDRGNNIVQILNKDYTCDKVIGSFDGQFAKPFRPLSVAISRFNHYFILDDENKQIVVCDENGKIIQIITLPENTEIVWDIALMDDFVLVTLRLTSPDTCVRPEDRDDRLVKYTQSGEYLAEVNGQIRGQGQFNWPVSVVVNSNNVIMVYDRGNECIKCFDSDLNFLHQFGQSQLSRGIVGYIGSLLWMKMIMFMFVTTLIES
ncbi:uncharacterized protein [Ptychodera flava]|uniref:uncharacterized protein n=1 Tax=Ptychodera flava TaxID=63121 RepID=UPI00396A6EC4